MWKFIPDDMALCEKLSYETMSHLWEESELEEELLVRLPLVVVHDRHAHLHQHCQWQHHHQHQHHLIRHLLLLLVRLKGEGLTDGNVVLSLVGRTVDRLHPGDDDDDVLGCINEIGRYTLKYINVYIYHHVQVDCREEIRVSLNFQFQKCTSLLFSTTNLRRVSSHTEYCYFCTWKEKGQQGLIAYI